MTRLPAETRNVRGLSGPQFLRYKCGPLCSVPGCSKFADHAHHIWRRSFIGGDHAWVELMDTHTIVGNLTGLCFSHHEEVTINKSRIEWDQRHRIFYWCGVRTDNSAQIDAALFPQPPVHGDIHYEVASGIDLAKPMVGPAQVGVCPGCKRSLPKEKGEKIEAKKRRKSWTITVPADSDEDGALVLDTLLESCADMFGHTSEKNMRYFTVVQALALVVQNSSILTKNGQT